MIEAEGNMFYDYLEPDVLYVITTNGYVRNNGTAVMGRGTAQAATRLQKQVDRFLGDLLLAWGNRSYLLPGNMVSLPTKHHWKEKSDIELIDRSLGQLRDLWTTVGKPRLYLPQPGCGNGGLFWHHVRPHVEHYFGDEENVTVWSLTV